MELKTQQSSKPRVKNDGMGEAEVVALFAKYAIEAPNTFRQSCIELIEASNGKRSKKDTFIYELNATTNKSFMLKKVTNYFLAGQGLGV